MENKKVCIRCGKTKSVSCFYKRTYKNANSYYSWCKRCLKEYRKSDIGKKWISQHYEENREKYIAASRESYIRRHYGVTPDKIAEMFVSQKNKCKICRKEFRIPKDIHIDHSHRTGLVRGLLCQKCNHGLGMFQDDINLLKAAIIYLKNSLAPLSKSGRKISIDISPEI